MTKLIIVCDEKHQKYADFLAQLISLRDDKGETIVGVKDGSVAAQVWLEKDYIANSKTISSDQFLVFIGDSKLARSKRSHMIVQYDHFGMKYGWLGRQAALCVHEIVGVEDYNDFFGYATGKQDNVERLIEENTKVEDAYPPDYAGFRVIVPDAVKKITTFGRNAIKQAASNTKIEDQQYSCLIYVFYLNGLSDFLSM